jgi:Tol biopolymer transport system component
MNDISGLERALRTHFESRADRAELDGQLAGVLATTARVRQRPAWLAALRSIAMTTVSIPARTTVPRAAWLLIVLGLIIVLAVAAAYVGRPAPPPFNGMIVYGVVDPAQNDTVVYVANPDGSHVRKLRPETHEGPHWSPNGEQIGLGGAFVNADGTGYHEVPLGPGDFTLIDWAYSPDGSRLLAEGFAEGDAGLDARVHGIYTVRASDGGDLFRITAPGEAWIPGTYSPDGRQVVVMGWGPNAEDGPIFIVDVDGKNQRALGTQRASSVDWSPDGKTILATYLGQLFKVDVATGISTRIVVPEALAMDIYGATWSPDGTRLLINAVPAGSDTFDLFTIKSDGTDLVRLTNDPAEERFLDWGTHRLDT